MRSNSEKPTNRALKRFGRYLLQRLEAPNPSYEQRNINNMKNLYREIKPGDVLLVEGRSKLSRIIQLITNSAWSHAAIYIADWLRDESVKGRLNGIDDPDRQHMLIEADAGTGVTAVPLNKYQVICSGMIAKAFQTVGYPIVPALLSASDLDNHLINDPYGSKLIMRHFSQIVPRDLDLSPNFEIIKYNIIGLGSFNYKSIWAEQ